MATDPALFFGNEKARNAHEWRYHNQTRENIRKENARRLARTAIYARVSTDQGEQDPTQQLEACRREAARRGLNVVWEGHDMVTGDSDVWERETGKQLWALVKGGKVDIVMTYDVSRLSRQHPTSVFKMLDLLRHNSVSYVSATESYFDFTEDNPFAEVVIFLTTFWNNYFLRKLSETTRRGKENAIKMGRKQGAHRKGCGKLFPCHNGTHDGEGRNVRRPLKPSLPKAAAQHIGNWSPQEMGGPPALVPASGNPPSQIGGAE